MQTPKKLQGKELRRVMEEFRDTPRMIVAPKS